MTNRPDVKRKLSEAKYLNGKMEELKAIVAKAPSVRQNSNYINEDPAEKEAMIMQLIKVKKLLMQRTIQLRIQLLSVKSFKK